MRKGNLFCFPPEITLFLVVTSFTFWGFKTMCDSVVEVGLEFLPCLLSSGVPAFYCAIFGNSTQVPLPLQSLPWPFCLSLVLLWPPRPKTGAWWAAVIFYSVSLVPGWYSHPEWSLCPSTQRCLPVLEDVLNQCLFNGRKNPDTRTKEKVMLLFF